MMFHMILSSNLKQPPMVTRSTVARRGFSFAEVMFAVVILGIGFIMVAAVFPVAIQQTQATGEQNIGAALARQAAESISQMPTTITNPVKGAIYLPSPMPVAPAPVPAAVSISTEYLFPPTVKNYVLGNGNNASPPGAIVVPFVGNRWDLVKSNVILPTDPRFAYVMFYKRDNNSPTAQLIVVAVAARNHPNYSSSTDLLNYPNFNSNVNDTNTNTTIAVTTPGDFPARQAQTVICADTLSLNPAGGSEGDYVQVPQSLTAPNPKAPLGRNYTLGALVDATSNRWELMPGDSMALTAGSDGLWGTAGALYDQPCSSQKAYLNAPATLQPVAAYAQLFITPDAPQGRIVINQGSMHSGVASPAAAPGAFVIIADDFPHLPTMAANSQPADYLLQPNIPPSATTNGYTVGAMNGRIFRLGVAIPASQALNIEPGTFNLDPAYGMRPAPPGISSSPDAIPNQDMLQSAQARSDTDLPLIRFYGSAKVYIIGVGRTSPTVVGNTTVSGSVQDIGVFTSFFQVQ